MELAQSLPRRSQRIREKKGTTCYDINASSITGTRPYNKNNTKSRNMKNVIVNHKEESQENHLTLIRPEELIPNTFIESGSVGSSIEAIDNNNDYDMFMDVDLTKPSTPSIRRVSDSSRDSNSELIRLKPNSNHWITAVDSENNEYYIHTKTQEQQYWRPFTSNQQNETMDEINRLTEQINYSAEKICQVNQEIKRLQDKNDYLSAFIIKQETGLCSIM
jgi:hypothetical protein